MVGGLGGWVHPHHVAGICGIQVPLAAPLVGADPGTLSAQYWTGSKKSESTTTPDAITVPPSQLPVAGWVTVLVPTPPCMVMNTSSTMTSPPPVSGVSVPQNVMTGLVVGGLVVGVVVAIVEVTADELGDSATVVLGAVAGAEDAVTAGAGVVVGQSLAASAGGAGANPSVAATMSTTGTTARAPWRRATSRATSPAITMIAATTRVVLAVVPVAGNWQFMNSPDLGGWLAKG